MQDTEFSARLELAPFDLDYLDRSFHWFQNAELRRLTATPPVTRERQREFFDSLPERKDYHLWGVSLGGAPIGAAGLKNVRGTTGEYWGYIGEPAYWGKKLGPRLLLLVEDQARALGVNELYLDVRHDNERAQRLYRAAGWKELARDAEGLRMAKDLRR
jgi:RimJ/RimL family protein N-acetyltransferase